MRPSLHLRRLALALAGAAGCALGMPAGTAFADETPWPGIRKEVFGARDMVEDSGKVVLEAPVRAEDAALVPITVRLPASVAPDAKALTLVIDKNPAPVVATFTFGDAAGAGERVISTRVRIDMYSDVRAILETRDGALHMATRFVKAAGGCSAPALKDADEALAQLGRMQVKTLAANGSGGAAEAQVMIRHPNYSGMQMNQLTGLYIPANYVSAIDVRRGRDLEFRMEGGISLSEDPNIRFTYAEGAGEPLQVTARDSDGRVFTATSAAKSGS
jgi:sulfur-oxidizing protein SoxY